MLCLKWNEIPYVFKQNIIQHTFLLNFQQVNQISSYSVELTPFDKLSIVEDAFKLYRDSLLPKKVSMADVEVSTFNFRYHFMFSQQVFVPKKKLFDFVQVASSFNYYVSQHGRQPSMGKSLFNEWSIIFKALGPCMNAINVASHDFYGKSLTKVRIYCTT